MADYSTFVDMAVDMITEDGMTVTLRREEQTDFNPDDGSYAGSSYLEQDVSGIFVGRSTMSYFPESLAVAGSREILLASREFDFVPTPGDVVVATSPQGLEELYDVLAVLPIEPAGTVIIYRLLVRH